MSNLHRVQWLDKQVRARRYPNCSDLAGEFCISRRQASRDVEYLRYSLGAPVEFDPRRNGYYYTDETFSLPALMIGREERHALCYLAGQYAASNSRLAGKLAELFSRLGGEPGAGAEAPPAVYRLDSRLIKVLDSLQQAVQQKRKVQLEYISLAQQRSLRTVWPLLLFRPRQVHYLAAWCEERQAERIFRLDRIRSLQVLKDEFPFPPWFNARKYGGDVRFSFRLPYTAEVRFEGPILPPVNGNGYTRLAETTYRVTFSDSAQLFAELIGLRCGFTLLQPAWLRRKCHTFFSGILEKNSG